MSNKGIDINQLPEKILMKQDTTEWFSTTQTYIYVICLLEKDSKEISKHKNFYRVFKAAYIEDECVMQLTSDSEAKMCAALYGIPFFDNSKNELPKFNHLLFGEEFSTDSCAGYDAWKLVTGECKFEE